jgi:uncharacterized membrane protein (UPF0182 family)
MKHKTFDYTILTILCTIVLILGLDGVAMPLVISNDEIPSLLIVASVASLLFLSIILLRFLWEMLFDYFIAKPKKD